MASRSWQLCSIVLAVVFLASLTVSLPADSTMQSSSSVSASFSSSSVQQSASASVSSPDKKQLVKTTTTTTSTTTAPQVVPLDQDEQQPDYQQPDLGPQPEPEPEPKPEPKPEPEPEPEPKPVDTDDQDLQNLQPNREESAVLKPVEETKANVEEEPNGNSIQQQASGNPEPVSSASMMAVSTMAMILSVFAARLMA